MSRFDSALLKIEAAGRGRYQGCRGAGARFGTLGRAAWIHSVGIQANRATTFPSSSPLSPLSPLIAPNVPLHSPGSVIIDIVTTGTIVTSLASYHPCSLQDLFQYRELKSEVPDLEIEPEADYTTLSTVGRQVLWTVINLDDKANTQPGGGELLKTPS